MIYVVKEDENEILLKIEGRLDSNNSEETEKELFAIARRIKKGGKLTLDLGEVEFLTSAGLRIFLNLRNKGYRIAFTNVYPEILDILDITGFSRMFDTEKAMRSCSIDGCEKLGQGANGEVYALDKDTIIKVFYPGIPLEDIRREKKLSSDVLIAGIPSVISFDTVKVGEDRYGNVYENLGTKTLSQAISEDPSKFDSLIGKYVKLLKKIHSTPGDGLDFPRTKDVYHSYFDGCKDWYTDEEMSALRKLVDSIPESNTLIHGDYHPNNIMVRDGKLLLIDLGDVSIGHHAFDFLSTAATQANLVDLNPQYAEIHTRMKVEYIKKGWQTLLEKYFHQKTTEAIGKIDRQARLLSKLKVACAPVIARGIPDELMQSSVNDVKQNLIPQIDGLTGELDW